MGVFDFQDYFKKFTLDAWTIGWENEADFVPEFLYDLVIKEKTNPIICDELG